MLSAGLTRVRPFVAAGNHSNVQHYYSRHTAAGARSVHCSATATMQASAHPNCQHYKNFELIAARPCSGQILCIADSCNGGWQLLLACELQHSVHKQQTKSSTCSNVQVWDPQRLMLSAVVILQAFTIIGGGRVGQALADMGPGNDVSDNRSSAAETTGLILSSSCIG
jgi:hypothetical protein